MAKGLGELEILSFPTPNLNDRIAVARRDPNAPAYAPADYGTAVAECTWLKNLHAERFDGFRLSAIRPDQRSGEHLWYFLNDRHNEDDYNFSTNYLNDSPDHPVVTRTYVVSREGVDSIPLSTTDPVNSELTLWQQQQIRIEDPILDGLFVAVTRVFGPLPGPPLVAQTLGQPSLLPPKYRRLVRQTETRTPVPPDTALPDDLTGDQIQVKVEQESVSKAIETVVEETIDENADPLVSSSLEDQEYVTIEVLVDEGDPADCGDGVVESQVAAVGDGKAIKTTKIAVTAYTDKDNYTPGFQTLAEESEGSVDAIPAKFRTLSKIKVWRYRVTQDAIPTTPALGTGSGDFTGYDLVERTFKQVRNVTGCGIWEVAVVGIDQTSGDLVSYEVGEGANRVTVTESLIATLPGPLDDDTAITKHEWHALGNGLWLQVVRVVAVFDADSRSIEKPDLTPAWVRAVIPTERTSIRAAGSISDPTLGTGELSKTIRKADEHVIETDVSSRDSASLPAARTIDEFGAAGRTTTAQTYDAEGNLPVEDGVNVIDSQVEPDGTGNATRSTRTAKKRTGSDTYVAGHPKKQVKAKGAQNLTPQKFRGQVTTKTTATQETLAANQVDDIPEPATPTGNQTSIEHEKVNDERYEKRVTEEIIGAGSPLAGKVLTGEQLVATVSEQLVTEGASAPAITAATESYADDALGNGKALRKIVTAPEVFDSRVESSEAMGQPPEKFLQGSTKTTRTVASGTSTTPGTVTGANLGGVVKSSKHRVTALKVETSNETLSTNKVALVGSKFDRKSGTNIPVTLTLETAGTQPAAPSTDGTYQEIEPVNANWSVKVASKTINVYSRTYTTIMGYGGIPRVLTSFTKQGLQFKKGGSRQIINYNLRAYHGPFLATITEGYTSTTPVPQVTKFEPTPIVWEGIHGNGSIPDCLHGQIDFTESTGTEDPVYEYIVASFSFPATIPTTVPASVVIEYDVTPYGAGFLYKKTTLAV